VFFIDYLSVVLRLLEARLLEAVISFFETGGRLQMAEQWRGSGRFTTEW
jgi:hypothetical protein